MGQFKQMVKMMTTEPTVELKLKKGGSVNGHKNMKSGGCMKSGGKADASGHSYMNGGISAALAGEPMIATKRSGSAPKVGKPSMAARRAAMKATGRGKANGGAMEALKKHEEKPASKAHKGLKTGGVVKGQGGYKTGGVIKGQGGYKKGGSTKKMAMGGVPSTPFKSTPELDAMANRIRSSGIAKDTTTGDTFKPQKSNSSFGEVVKKMGMQSPKDLVKPLTTNPPKSSVNSFMDDYAKDSANLKSNKGSMPAPMTSSQGGKGLSGAIASGSGGLGSVVKDLGLYGKDAQAASKPLNKFNPSGPSTGGIMPTKETRANLQNINNPFAARTPSRIMKKGGSSKKFAEGGSVNDGGRPQRMPQGAKKPSNPVEINKLSGTFKKGGKVKKYAEGGMSDYESEMSPQERMKEMRMRKAMEEGYEGTRKRDTMANEALLDSISSLPTAVKNMIRKAMRGQGAVTDTETTVSRTVVPAKKRGGKVCK